MANRTIKRKRQHAPGVSPEIRSVSDSDNVSRIEDRREAVVSDDETDGSELDAGSEDSGTVSAPSYEFIEPTAADSGGRDDSGSGTGTGRGRRGRKPGSRNKRTKAQVSETTQAISGVLFSTHLMLAQWMQADEIAITTEEAETLGNAITRVSQLYDIGVMGEKAAAWINLSIALDTIYGPRIVTVNKRVKDREQKRPQVIRPNVQGQTINSVPQQNFV